MKDKFEEVDKNNINLLLTKALICRHFMTLNVDLTNFSYALCMWNE